MQSNTQIIMYTVFNYYPFCGPSLVKQACWKNCFSGWHLLLLSHVSGLCLVALEDSQNEDKNKGNLILLCTENQNIWLSTWHFHPINHCNFRLERVIWMCEHLMLCLVSVLQGEFQGVFSLELLFKSTWLNYLLPQQRVLMRFGGFGFFPSYEPHTLLQFQKDRRNLTQKPEDFLFIINDD